MNTTYHSRQTECPGSPTGRHCWHPVEGKKAQRYPYWLAMCCWCGGFRYQENVNENIPDIHGRHQVDG